MGAVVTRDVPPERRRGRLSDHADGLRAGDLILFGSGLFFYAGKYKRLKKIGGWYLIIPLMMALTFPRMQPAGQQGGLVFSPTKTGTLEPLPKLPNGHVATVNVTELGPVQVRREDGRYMAEDDILGRFLGKVYKNPVD